MVDGVDYDGGDDEGLVDRLSAWDDVDIEAVLERSQDAAAQRLEQELKRIDAQLDGRDAVHEEIVDELEWKIERYTDRLESLYKRGSGRRDGTRERLRNRIESFYRELREERREHWQDRQDLAQERRSVLRELEELDEDLLAELL